MSVRVPGQAPIDYIHREGVELPSPLVTTAQMQDGSQQVHIAGGFDKRETMALELAKSFVGGGHFDRERLPNAVKIGEWATLLAESILVNCAERKVVGSRLIGGELVSG